MGGEIGFRLQIVHISGSETLVHSDTVRAVLETLAVEDHSDPVRVQQLAEELLVDLIDTDEKVYRTFESKPPVLKVLREAQRKSKTCESAMNVVSKMLLTFLQNPKHRGKIDEMALNTTLKLFNEFPEYTMHTLHVMQIITLIKQTDGLYSFTLDNIGIHAVTRALRFHNTKPTIQYHACDSLCWLIDCAEDVESFTRVKGIASCLDVLRRDTEDSESNDTMSDDAGKSTLRCRCVDVLLSLVRIEQNIGKTELLATNTISTVAAAMRAMNGDTL